MTVRMRHTRAHTGNRRSHHALVAPRLSTCDHCKKSHLRHHVCENCGFYRGKEMVDITARVEAKQKKQDEKKKALAGK